MSKLSMPRPRYVAFRITAARPVDRRAVANAVRDAAGTWPAGATAPHLTRYAWPHGVVRVEHTEASALRALLVGLRRIGDQDVAVDTLATSGTLKALAASTGVLIKRD